MQTILCYGDSNTWGYDPHSGSRFPRDIRWTGVLQRLLGDDYLVVEEGLCARTIAFSTSAEPELDGLAYLPACLKSHAPLDMVVLMLGGNDLQLKYNATPLEIARGMERMVQWILTPYHHGLGSVPKILLISPPPAGEGINRFFLRELFGGEAVIERSKLMARRLRGVAKTYNCLYLDAGNVVRTSEADGLHLDAVNHSLLAEAIATIVKAQG